jgi:hypothetical protein
MTRLFRVAGRAIAVSVFSLAAWLVLGTRPLFYLVVFMTFYTAIMVPLVLRAYQRVNVSRRLRQSVVQMKSQDTITMTLEGMGSRSPLSIQLDVLLPPYIIRDTGAWHGLSWVQEFKVNRRGTEDIVIERCSGRPSWKPGRYQDCLTYVWNTILHPVKP